MTLKRSLCGGATQAQLAAVELSTYASLVVPTETDLPTPHRPRQAEYEQYTIDQGREMEALHQQHKAESHVLKMRVQDLEASFADSGRDEEVRIAEIRAHICFLILKGHIASDASVAFLASSPQKYSILLSMPMPIASTPLSPWP